MSYIDPVKTVGIRELKNRLSNYLRLAALGRQGFVVLATRTDSAEYPPLPLPRNTPGLAARLLDDERGQR